MTKVLVCAGDASGDAHSAEFLTALGDRVPSLSAFGLGGDALRRAGLELLVDQRELAVGGLVEALGAVRAASRALDTLASRAAHERPDLAILVDSPDLNLPLAKRMRRLQIPVLYYIAPQVWAWRTSRIRTLATRVSRLAVIFPFECDVFRGSGLPVDFVGHPLVDRMAAIRRDQSRESARERLGIDRDVTLVAMLPGSRRNEIASGLRLHLESAQCMKAARPDLQFAIPLAPTVATEQVDEEIARARLPADFPLRLVRGETYPLLVACDVAAIKPGTATIEATLLERPFVTLGRAHPVTAFAMRHLVRVPSFTMPNLIAGFPVVPEFLQENAVPERIAQALLSLLDDTTRTLQLARLRRVAAALGSGGAAERAADLAAQMIRERVAAA